MNSKSSVETEERSSLSLHPFQVYRWFVARGGKETSPVEKPLDTPLQPGEEEGDDFIPQPKMRSRRYPIKTMFMGCVGRPRKDKNFDGKIFLERISETSLVTEQTRKTANQNFSDDVLVNSEIKNGAWRQYFVEDMTFGELTMLMGEHYDLDEHIFERLELSLKFA